MFIRYCFLQLLEGSFGILPIFIELRGLNSVDSTIDLTQFIYQTVVRPGAVVTRDQFDKCLRESMFILILDGLDEVEHDRRLTVQQQITHLREAYPKLGIVVTSRPDDPLSRWTDFKIYHIEPMKKAQIKKLINKLPYNPELKRRFVQELDKTLYATHESFLSNPLLATMMLMTFDQFAHIPDKIHIFYEQAFETLFFRHDAGKQAAFRRKMYTDLPINDFKNCLSALCVSTYFKNKFQFNEAEILEYINTASKSEKISVLPNDYLKDLLESVCVLQRDGLFIGFSHRSLQEYFAACYIARSPSTSISELLDAFATRSTDNVIRMAFDMNRGLIERE
jgi:predicted NACHT family NTPase